MQNFKKYFLLILICSSCVSNKKEDSKNILILGHVRGLKDSTLVVLEKSGNKQNIDSTYSLKEKFILNYKKITIQEGLFYLTFYTKAGKELYSFNFWGGQPENIVINGNFETKKNIKVIDSRVNNVLKKYRVLPNKYSNKIDKLFDSNKNQKEKNLIFKKYMDTIKKDQINFLFKNPNTAFTLDEFFRLNEKISKDSILIFYNSLDDNLKASKNGELLKKQTLSKRIKIGEIFRDFKAKDLNGNYKKLSDYKGKIIVLDFWAYWCKWCHVQNKEEFSYLNEKYKDDLVIISYSLDEEKDVWKKSTEKHSYKWVNISNLLGVKDPVAFQYGVKLLPHSFLIDKNGVLQKEFIGYKKDSLIEKEIKKLLNTN
ncbi:TlpA family protein disulfide reductase [Polaribacter sp. IC073]|uniref:TlpA family protein disulfide reductase n=1 Tax=Polaribacter sp. IC073 TaxID=2508540 RepID=UPI0011BF25D6|nr:TlpA disulfide reductase family protein [Polaribacter sp. IC073]TXD50050.1 TlpA family protein disulfide reductase [Polaribacter sp. IC073]